ncbi:hypothetical protein C8F01DRAFT_1292699, partial [Mycena amicta]
GLRANASYFPRQSCSTNHILPSRNPSSSPFAMSTTTASPHRTPERKTTRIVTRSASGASFYFKRDPPGPRILPKTFLSLRDDLVLHNRVTEYMEDHDEIYRGETECPPSYAPLTPEREEIIVANLPEDDSLAVVSGPADAFVDLFSLPGWRDPLPSPQRTYAGRRSTLSVASESVSSVTTSADESETASEAADDGSPRRSARLQGSDSSERPTHVIPLRQLRVMYKLQMAYPDATLPTPFVDSDDVLVSVLLRGPSREAAAWRIDCAEVGNTLHFLSKAVDVFGEEGRIRWGVGFRPEGDNVDGALHWPQPEALKRYLETDEGRNKPTLRRIAEYQIHALDQFFPVVSSAMRVRAEMLEDHDLIAPIPHSPFTTCEVRNLQELPMATPQKQWEVRFCDMMAVTVLGMWDWEREGHLMLHAEGRMVALKCGDTFLIPAGAQAYSFVPVTSEGSSQFLFCQTFHSSVARWLEKGGICDLALDLKAKNKRNVAWAKVLHRWVNARKTRGLQSRKFFQKMREVSSVVH